MPARNYKQWTANPPLQAGEWIDSRIYTDQEIFDEELEKIFKSPGFRSVTNRNWRNPTTSAPPASPTNRSSSARGPDNVVRAFLNVCPHRGMIIERRPSGSFYEASASGNPKRMTCMFHAWQFDLKGNCVYVSREKEGYQDRLCKEDVGLRRCGAR